jgi:plasmid stabilization system protein ParE
MVKFTVRVASKAQKSIQRIHDWLVENESQVVADQVTAGILDTIGALETMPERHAVFQELSDEKRIIRRVLKWSYKIIFSVKETQIEVLVIDVLHSKQNKKSSI